MKKIKIFILAIIVTAMGVAVSAFVNTNSQMQKSTVMHYYEFTGTSNNDVGIPGNWDDLGEQPSLQCEETSGTICFVKFNGDINAFQTYVNGKSFAEIYDDGLIQAYRE